MGGRDFLPPHPNPPTRGKGNTGAPVLLQGDKKSMTGLQLLLDPAVRKPLSVSLPYRRLVCFVPTSLLYEDGAEDHADLSTKEHLLRRKCRHRIREQVKKRTNQRRENAEVEYGSAATASSNGDAVNHFELLWQMPDGDAICVAVAKRVFAKVAMPNRPGSPTLWEPPNSCFWMAYYCLRSRNRAQAEWRKRLGWTPLPLLCRALRLGCNLPRQCSAFLLRHAYFLCVVHLFSRNDINRPLPEPKS